MERLVPVKGMLVQGRITRTVYEVVSWDEENIRLKVIRAGSFIGGNYYSTAIDTFGEYHKLYKPKTNNTKEDWV